MVFIVDRKNSNMVRPAPTKGRGYNPLTADFVDCLNMTDDQIQQSVNSAKNDQKVVFFNATRIYYPK